MTRVRKKHGAELLCECRTITSQMKSKLEATEMRSYSKKMRIPWSIEKVLTKVSTKGTLSTRNQRCHWYNEERGLEKRKHHRAIEWEGERGKQRVTYLTNLYERITERGSVVMTKRKRLSKVTRNRKSWSAIIAQVLIEKHLAANLISFCESMMEWETGSLAKRYIGGCGEP